MTTLADRLAAIRELREAANHRHKGALSFDSSCADCMKARGARKQLELAVDAVTASVEALGAALERLQDAAEAYSAIQEDAPDSRVGLVQPITVADGNALNEALDCSRKALDTIPDCGFEWRQAEGDAERAKEEHDG